MSLKFFLTHCVCYFSVAVTTHHNQSIYVRKSLFGVIVPERLASAMAQVAGVVASVVAGVVTGVVAGVVAGVVTGVVAGAEAGNSHIFKCKHETKSAS